MLPIETTACIRESIDAELSPRHSNLTAALVQVDSEFAARGAFNSRMRLQQRTVAGCRELAVRAEIVWDQIRRCLAAFHASPDQVSFAELEQVVKEQVAAQAVAVTALVDATPAPASFGRWKTVAHAEFERCRDALIKKFSNEARFLVRELERSSTTRPMRDEATNVVVYGNVGSLLTGHFTTSHIHIDGQGATRLIESLEQLQLEISRNAEITAEQRAQSTELIAELIAYSHAQQPSAPRIIGLLNGLAISIQTVASLRGAWDFVRDVARLLGIT